MVLKNEGSKLAQYLKSHIGVHPSVSYLSS